MAPAEPSLEDQLRRIHLASESKEAGLVRDLSVGATSMVFFMRIVFGRQW